MEATHIIHINESAIYVAVGSNQFTFISDPEQCHDCGGDEYSLVGKERDGSLALHCDKCGTDHRLRSLA